MRGSREQNPGGGSGGRAGGSGGRADGSGGRADGSAGRTGGSARRGRKKTAVPGQRPGILDTVAERFDLPADVVAGLPRLELIGSRQLYLEHHTGILSYSEERVDAGTEAGVLRVEGRGLTLLAMTAEELRLGGTILSVAWGEGT